MQISQKSHYALRALLELARHYGKGWVKISDIAKTQNIPIRFLEVILSQVKQSRFIVSRRGADGGYMLAVDPSNLTIGQVLRFTQSSVGPMEPISESNTAPSFYGYYALVGLWAKAQKGISEVYDRTTFLDLINNEEGKRKELAREEYIPSYAI